MARGGGFTQPSNSLTLPIRAAFHFPWYDEAWDQLGYTPFTRFTPSRGAYYDQRASDSAVLNDQLAQMAYANCRAAIPTWRGRSSGGGISATTFAGSQTNSDEKILTMLELAWQHGIKVAILYEVEAYANPTLGEVQAEFTWLFANRFNHPGYLRVGGLPVIFVYTGADHSDALAQKYSDATSGFTTAYVMMMTVTDASANVPQPQGWFQFTNARTATATNSIAICPGYWRIDEANPVTARNLATWQANIATMVASGKDWHLINSFNEWGEGSQFEPDTTHGTDYLEALHDG